MKCPECKSPKSKILTNYAVGWVEMRVRKCLECGKEYPTQEKVTTIQEKVQ